MTLTLDPELRRALAERVRYCHEMGIYDFYRRESRLEPTPAGLMEAESASSEMFLANSSSTPTALDSGVREDVSALKTSFISAIADDNIFEIISPKAEYGAADPVAALKLIREDLGDCTRCKLHRGRTNLVFGVGNPRAELMFVGEGPGADEDAQGEPFVGRAGQLLNNMIKAMGLRREEVYIANVVKCRPPGNRTPEPDECETCSPFLMRQIATIKPKVVVALGATAAKNLLAMNSSLGDLRGRFYDFKPTGSDASWSGARLAVTYHPAYLLRDPRQKGEAWKDLQMVMKYLGIEPPKKAAE